MYHYEATNGTIFHHNSDFSGDVIIITRQGKERIEIKIPGQDILEFVAYKYIMDKKIDAIESKNWEELYDS